MSESLVCIADYEKLAKKILPRNALTYYKSGAGDEQSLNDNVNAFKRWRFRPQVLRDVSDVDTSSSLLGTHLPFPICVAPTGMNRMAHPDGELTSAKAACSLGTGFTLSSWATTSVEEIEEKVPNVNRWFQLDSNPRTIGAEKSGFRGLILTVDIPTYGSKYECKRIKFSLPPHLKLKNFHSNKSINFHEGQIKDERTAEMALEAVDHKIDGIIVSNHGGRQLDGVTSTIEALPEVVRAVNGRCEVYLDGGIRNGGDVAKAIALGAKAVFVGRPMIWGMTCEGEDGARKVLEILWDEFKQTMQLLGVTSIAELQTVSNLIVHETRILSKL